MTTERPIVFYMRLKQAVWVSLFAVSTAIGGTWTIVEQHAAYPHHAGAATQEDLAQVREDIRELRSLLVERLPPRKEKLDADQ